MPDVIRRMPARTERSPPASPRKGPSRHLIATVENAVFDVVGTGVGRDRPLMDAGLDSVGASELASALAATLKTELAPTLLFDHPSVGAVAAALSATMPQEEEPSSPGPPTTIAGIEARIRARLRLRNVEVPPGGSILTALDARLAQNLPTDNTEGPFATPDVGGSLRALFAQEFLGRLGDAFGLELPPDLLDRHPTVEGIARAVAGIAMPRPSVASKPASAVGLDVATLTLVGPGRCFRGDAGSTLPPGRAFNAP